MKKNQLLNSELSYLVATLGHTDEVTVCDAGLPVPETTSRIDLALTHGVPGFIETARTLLAEMQIEGVVLATEFREISPDLHAELLGLLEIEEQKPVKPSVAPILVMKHLKPEPGRAGRSCGQVNVHRMPMLFFRPVSFFSPGIGRSGTDSSSGSIPE